METAKKICIYGAPMDLGQSRRGVDMGPSAIRYAGLQHRLEQIGWNVIDCGNVDAPVTETVHDKPLPEGKAYNAYAVAQVCQSVYDRMTETLDAGQTAIFLGGDHSMALGTVAAFLNRPGRGGVIWVDAHGDFNTPLTSPSGNVHGMVVSHLMGMGSKLLMIGERRLSPDQIVMIGIRDLDDDERAALRESGIKVLTMRDIDENGMAAVVKEALRALRGATSIHVSFDMDSLDPSIAPGVGTPVLGGLRYREAHLLMEMLHDDGRVGSLDIVEVNPILDIGNRTAEVAVELAASLFGQRII